MISYIKYRNYLHESKKAVKKASETREAWKNRQSSKNPIRFTPGDLEAFQESAPSLLPIVHAYIPKYSEKIRDLRLLREIKPSEPISLPQDDEELLKIKANQLLIGDQFFQAEKRLSFIQKKLRESSEKSPQTVLLQEAEYLQTHLDSLQASWQILHAKEQRLINSGAHVELFNVEKIVCFEADDLKRVQRIYNSFRNDSIGLLRHRSLLQAIQKS